MPILSHPSSIEEVPVLVVLGPVSSGKTDWVVKQFRGYKYFSFKKSEHCDALERDPDFFFEFLPQKVILDNIELIPDFIKFIYSHLYQQWTRKIVLVANSRNCLPSSFVNNEASWVKSLKIFPKIPDKLSNQAVDLFSEENFLQPKLQKKGLMKSQLQKKNIEQHWVRLLFEGKKEESLALEDVEVHLKSEMILRKKNEFRTFLKKFLNQATYRVNTKQLGEEVGVSHNTIREWMGDLTNHFIGFELKNYDEGFGKRVIRNSKYYFFDSSLLLNHWKMNDPEELLYHERFADLFENFVIASIAKISFNFMKRYNLYYWRENHGRKVDLIIESENKLVILKILASSTFQESTVRDLNYWEEISGYECEKKVVYLGPSSMKGNIQLLSVLDLDQVLCNNAQSAANPK